MQKSVWNQLAEYVKNNRFRSAWKKVVLVLACVVVFCTTYALILPAITMEQKSYCGLEEHTHTKDCYRQIPVASELICPLVEGEAISVVQTVSDGDGEALVADKDMQKPHTHTEECYTVPKEPPLTCTLTEGEDHTHEFLCYGSWELTCTKEEHTHDLGCFADTQADVESYAVWENMVTNMDLTGIWAEDVVTIAKGQLGYAESARNYIVNEDTTVNGYTRYGAWGNAPYGDWDAMFASFCLYYAGVEDMPLGADSRTWIKELSDANLYRMAAAWEPQPGNLLFTDEDMDGMADHVAVVSEYTPAAEGVSAQIKVVQGDVSDQVQYVTYEAEDGHILGYGILPKQPDPVLTHTYSDETLQVEVELPEGTRVPGDAKLVVTAIEENSEKYAELLNQAQEAVTESVVKARFYDISFYSARREYIPVSEKAKVIMRFREDMVDADANTVILHYDDNDSAPVVLEEVNVEEQTVTAATTFALPEAAPLTTENSTVVTYETEGFSVFGVVEVETTATADDSASLITNLDGEIMMIVAVNNDDSIDGNEEGEQNDPSFYWAQTLALNSQIGDADYFAGTEVSSTIENQLITSITTTDPNNNLAWEFEAVPDRPGEYYIRVANFYNTPNSNAGKYIYFHHQGSGLDGDSTPWQRDIRLGNESQRQAFQVVRGQYNNGNYVREMVCLRTYMDGKYRYIQLGQNKSNMPFYNSAHFGEDNAHHGLGYPGNHFVLSKLSDTTEEGRVVNRLNEILNQMPGSEEEFTTMTEPEGSTFTQQIALRENLRRLAMEAMALCNEDPDALSALQKNFIGQERFEKLKNLKTNMEWLWRENPAIVPNDVELEAKINLFNYNGNVNNDNLATQHDFTFYDYTDLNVENQENRKTIDGVGDLDGEYMIPNMNPKLVDGYPYIENGGSLQYLFAPNNGYLQGTMTDGGGLFQKDENGYYYYYSDKNATWYNPTTNRFELYNVAVYPEFIREQYNKGDDSKTDEAHGNFYPFNPILEGGANDISNVIYDGETVTSRYDNGETQSAFLNEKADLWFGMSIEYDFFIPEGAKVTTPNQEEQDMIFEFHGDDDVFVYIDDVLVLNLGGTHTAQHGIINFTTGDVTWTETIVEQTGTTDNDEPIYSKRYEEKSIKLAKFFENSGVNTAITDTTLADYSMHNLKFYYMERGGTYSYAGIKFNMPALPENALLVRKELTADCDYIDAGLDYDFKILQANSQANTVTENSFFAAGTQYHLYGAGTQEGDMGQVAADGSFTLKGGQVALFENVVDLVAVGGSNEFVVQEIFPDWVKEQYTVSYDTNVVDEILLNTAPNGKSAHGAITGKPQSGYTTYQTDIYSIEKDDGNYTQIVTVYNDVVEEELDTLTITKEVPEGSGIGSGESFDIRVSVGNDSNSLKLLPEGTEYVVTSSTNAGDTRTVGNDGIIRLQVGEKATIKGFLADTYWEIQELLTNNQEYSPSYRYIYSDEYGNASESQNGNAWYFGENVSTIDFTVTNYPTNVNVDIGIKKVMNNHYSSQLFNFVLEQGSWDAENQLWEGNGTIEEIPFNVGYSGESMQTKLNFQSTGENATYYYKLSERKGDADFIYDDTYYIIEVQLTSSGSVAQIGRVWKDGTELYEPENTNEFLFENYKAIPLTVHKDVVGPDGIFTFEMEILFGNPKSPFTNMPQSDDYTIIADGTIRFQLSDKESITIMLPRSAEIIVRETDGEGYTTVSQVHHNGSFFQNGNGIVAQEWYLEHPTDIYFTNEANFTYELPATGGSGTRGYLLGGLMLVLVAAGLLYFKRRGLS